MKEVRVKVSIKNNILFKYREGVCLDMRSFAKFLGVSIKWYQDMENLKTYPIKDGYWDDHALQAATVLETEPEKLFPESLSLLTNNVSIKEMDVNEFKESLALIASNGELSTPQYELLDIEHNKRLTEQVSKALKTITPREERVVRLRLGLDGTDEEKTLEEIGEILGVGKERIRQIDMKALRKLRHRSRSKKLREFVEEQGEAYDIFHPKGNWPKTIHDKQVLASQAVKSSYELKLNELKLRLQKVQEEQKEIWERRHLSSMKDEIQRKHLQGKTYILFKNNDGGLRTEWALCHYIRHQDQYFDGTLVVGAQTRDKALEYLPTEAKPIPFDGVLKNLNKNIEEAFK